MNRFGDHLLFRLDDAVLGIEATAVREVHWLPELSPPAVRSVHIAGIVNLRGTLITVLDLRYALGKRPRALRIEDGLLVIECRGTLLGILVSELLDVQPVAVLREERLPITGAPDEPAPLVAAVAQGGDNLAMLLNLDAILSLLSQKSIAGTQQEDTAPDVELTPEARSILRTRTANLREEVQNADTDALVQLVLFRLNGETFAVSLEGIREFGVLKSITRVPCCPPHILGLITLRGEIFSLIDVRATLSLRPATRDGNAHVFVAEVAGNLFAFAVDQVTDVVRIPRENLNVVPAAAPSRPSALVGSSVLWQGTTIAVLDLPRLVADGGLTVDEEV